MQRLLRSNGPLRVRLNLGLLLLFILAGLLAPLLPLHDPVTPYPLNRLKPPSAEHPFGTDGNGMDVLSRTIFAIRTDFALALSSVALGIVVGAPLGALSGYFGGKLDSAITRVTEVFQGFPQILFGMAVLAAAGNTMVNLVLIIAFYNVPVYSKMVRSVTLPLRQADFVLAARVAGNSPLSVVFRHVLPNTLVPVVFPAAAQLRLRCADDRRAELHRPGCVDPDAGVGLDDSAGRQPDGLWQVVGLGLPRPGALLLGVAVEQRERPLRHAGRARRS